MLPYKDQDQLLWYWYMKYGREHPRPKKFRGVDGSFAEYYLASQQWEGGRFKQVRSDREKVFNDPVETSRLLEEVKKIIENNVKKKK